MSYTYKNKLCIICNKEFAPKSSNQKSCDTCIPIYRKTYKTNWANNNKEHLKELRHIWYWNNLDKARNIRRKWNWSKGGQKYRKKYYLTHKKLINDRLNDYKDRTESRIKAVRIIEKLNIPRICTQCGSIKAQIHHKDGNPMNNTLSNLEMLCLKCHTELHHQLNLIIKGNPRLINKM